MQKYSTLKPKGLNTHLFHGDPRKISQFYVINAKVITVPFIFISHLSVYVMSIIACSSLCAGNWRIVQCGFLPVLMAKILNSQKCFWLFNCIWLVPGFETTCCQLCQSAFHIMSIRTISRSLSTDSYFLAYFDYFLTEVSHRIFSVQTLLMVGRTLRKHEPSLPPVIILKNNSRQTYKKHAQRCSLQHFHKKDYIRHLSK